MNKFFTSPIKDKDVLNTTKIIEQKFTKKNINKLHPSKIINEEIQKDGSQSAILG